MSKLNFKWPMMKILINYKKLIKQKERIKNLKIKINNSKMNSFQYKIYFKNKIK